MFLITDVKLLKLLSVVCGFGSQTYICKNYIQNICSVLTNKRFTLYMGDLKTPNFSSEINWPLACKRQICQRMNFKAPEALQACWISTNDLRNSCSYEQGVNPRRNISIGVVLLFMTCSYKPSDQFRFIYNVPEYHSFTVIFFAFKKQRETKKSELGKVNERDSKGYCFLSFISKCDWVEKDWGSQNSTCHHLVISH